MSSAALEVDLRRIGTVPQEMKHFVPIFGLYFMRFQMNMFRLNDNYNQHSTQKQSISEVSTDNNQHF